MENVARAYAEQIGCQFHRKIGAGAFKETFLVEMASGLAALKVLGEKCSTNRTEREISALQRCSHPNIGSLRTVESFMFQGKEYVCLIEDYLDGGTLGDQLRQCLLTRNEVLRVGSGLILALDYLDGIGLVHRDLKPENIMFHSTRPMEPVIVDFGLVRDLNESSITKTWFPQGPGTPFFAPAEQLNNKKDLIDWRADQFSTGVTLSVCLFGVHPYQMPEGKDGDCVDRVATWQTPAAAFATLTEEVRMPALLRMVQPYPVQRFRKPSQLLEAWAAQ